MLGKLKCIITGLLTFSLICEAAILQADQTVQQPLFRIERNTNNNIIQYDAQVGPTGELDKKKPVLAYWIRLAEQGQVKKLSWLQRKFAYGFKSKFDPKTDTATLEMAADIGRPIKVQREGETYKAIADINGKPSRIVKIFIHATGKGLSAKVDFIELHGINLDTGDKTFERFVP